MADAAPRLVVFTDKRTGRDFTMTVPPGSPWWPLLGPVTEADVRALTAAEIADDAAYRDAGGIVLARPDAKAAR